MDMGIRYSVKQNLPSAVCKCHPPWVEGDDGHINWLVYPCKFTWVQIRQPFVGIVTCKLTMGQKAHWSYIEHLCIHQHEQKQELSLQIVIPGCPHRHQFYLKAYKIQSHFHLGSSSQRHKALISKFNIVFVDDRILSK